MYSILPERCSRSAEVQPRPDDARTRGLCCSLDAQYTIPPVPGMIYDTHLPGINLKNRELIGFECGQRTDHTDPALRHDLQEEATKARKELRTANGVDRAQAGSWFGKEIDFVHSFLFVSVVSSSCRNAYY